MKRSGTNRVVINQSGGGGSNVSINSISVGRSSTTADVQVVNGRVWIDGEEIPDDVDVHTTSSGQVFRIHRNGGKVEVHSE